MKKFASVSLGFAGLFLSASLLASTNPFNLAGLGYQGFFSSATLENGKRLGGFATYCQNVRVFPEQSAYSLFSVAEASGRLGSQIDRNRYLSDLEDQMHSLCLNN